jgi:hypothetical protein
MNLMRFSNASAAYSRMTSTDCGTHDVEDAQREAKHDREPMAQSPAELARRPRDADGLVRQPNWRLVRKAAG